MKLLTTLAAATLLAAPALAQQAPAPTAPMCKCCERMAGDTAAEDKMDCCEKDANGKMTCTMMQGMDHSSIDHGTMDHGSMDHSQMNHGTMDHTGHGAAEPQ